ncbi:MAG: hypothetical protein NVS3B20_11340 [Polyangiales bacterium]
MALSEKKGKGSDPAKVPVASKVAPTTKEAVPASKAKAAPPPPPIPAKPGDKGLPKRKLGIKGAAPWAARHAAKHAAEARARAAEPAPPGSARATIRTPNGADEIKEKLNELLKCTNQLKALRKNLGKNFYEIGHLLREVQQKKLYEPRGYTSFDAFIDRETELGKELGLKIARIALLFTKEGAMEMGLDRLVQALSALDQPKDYQSESKVQAAPQRPSGGIRVVEPSGRAF